MLSDLGQALGLTPLQLYAEPLTTIISAWLSNQLCIHLAIHSFILHFLSLLICSVINSLSGTAINKVQYLGLYGLILLNGRFNINMNPILWNNAGLYQQVWVNAINILRSLNKPSNTYFQVRAQTHTKKVYFIETISKRNVFHAS